MRKTFIFVVVGDIFPVGVRDSIVLQMKQIFIIALVVISTNFMLAQGEAPLLTIPDGKLIGTSGTTVKEKIPYYAYRGIPFAKKPVGDLRFAPPVKNEPWTGILNATEDKDKCTQMSSGHIDEVSGPVVGSEDCLYMNVYTTNVSSKLPVMVWIYGGAFVGGSSAYDEYAPDYLLEKDVVYAAFNYRLGVFGFLSTEDTAASGNWGLKDQVLALKWVKENIKYFGGDPEKITIFGQSAGGASVSYLVQSKLTRGLYRGAIMESGTSLCLWALTRHARERAFNVGLKLGIITLSSQSLINKLRTVEYKALKYAEINATLQFMLTENLLAGLPFGVVKELDHPGAVFSNKSWQQFSIGDFERVPLIAGFTSNEFGSLYHYINVIKPILFQYGLDVTRLVPYDLTQNWLKRLAAGTEIKSHYFGILGPVASQPQALVRFVNVDMFERPIRETVSQAAKYSKVYYYEFSYVGLLGDANKTYEGVGHADDLNYIFVVKNQTISPRDWTTVQRMVTLWTNFAKAGDPTPKMSGNNSILGELIWEPNDSSTGTNTTAKYLNINGTLSMETNPFQKDWIFYQGIYNRFGEPPYTTY